MLGAQAPSYRAAPPCRANDAAQALAVNRAGGLDPMPWQEGLLSDWLGRDADGMWAAPTCGLSVPRQNGKTLAFQSRANHGMLALGEWVVYTSHLQKTSTETFLEMKAFFEHPAVAKRVKCIKGALGREEIILNNGGRVQFVARTRNGGRGLHGDLLVFDEAQELTAAQQAAFLPAISASANPQALYLGTPPDENCDGSVFRRIRREALGGKSTRTAWAEWSVDGVGDVADRARWAQANPSMGLLIKESTIESECEQMAHDTFARERLGWWSPEATEADACVDASAWDEARTAEPPESGVPCFAVKFAPDGRRATIAVCLKADDGPYHVECVAHSDRGGAEWAWGLLRDAMPSAGFVVVDGKAHAEDLLTVMRDAKVPRRACSGMTPSEVADACAMFSAAVGGRAVTHYGQGALSESVVKCRRRSIGREGWGFDGRGLVDETYAEAAAMAYWAARKCKRDPRRKALIG